MNIPLNTKVSLACELIALLCGLWFIRKSTIPVRLVMLQVALALSVECYVTFAGLRQANNMHVYNTYLVFDNILLMVAGGMIVNVRAAQKIIIAGSAGYTIYWLFVITSRGLSVVWEPLFMVSFFMITILYLFVLYNRLLIDERKFYEQPIFWLGVGLIIFYGISTPHFALLKLISKNVKAKGQREILNRMVDIASDLRYLCTATFFYTVHRFGMTSERKLYERK